MKKILPLATAILFSALAQISHAQIIDFKSVIAQGSTQTISFDAAFEQSHTRALDLHFTLDVPVNEGQLRLQSNYNQPDRYGSLRFLTADGQVIEMVDLFSGTISSGPIDEREAFLANLLQNETVPNLGTFNELNVIGARRATVGPYAAIEVVALYQTEAYGQIALRAVGVFPPAGENILVFISHTVLGAIELASVNDLPATFAGTLLDSLRFTATRTPDGRLKGF